MNDKQKSIFEDGQILLFDKPVYWTSFDLINKVRIIIRSTFGIKKIKVGHAGTLDPLASGLMIVCTGKATKKIDEFRIWIKNILLQFTLEKQHPRSISKQRPITVIPQII